MEHESLYDLFVALDGKHKQGRLTQEESRELERVKLAILARKYTLRHREGGMQTPKEVWS